MIDTNQTLLDRLKALPAHDAWREFYDGYWSPILRYARRLGLSSHQAEEVLQETMVALMRILPGFQYDPRRGRFRNFLLTIVHRKGLQALRRTRRQTTIALDAADGAAKPVENMAIESSDRVATAELDRWRQTLFEDSLAQLRTDPEVDERTRAVFESYVVQRRSARAVAAEFGLKENAVYQIKNRLVRRLRVMTARRLRDSGSDP